MDSKQSTRIIGLDWATKADKVGVVSALSIDGGKRCVIERAESLARLASVKASSASHGAPCVSALDALTKSEESTRTLLCIDAPLGWPDPFRAWMSDHGAGEGAPLEVDFDRFFRRATDDVVAKLTGKRPLEVSANFIGRTAGSVLAMLSRLRGERAEDWPALTRSIDADAEFSQGIIEVYPGALLTCLETDSRGYKKSKTRRGELLEELSALYALEAGGEEAYLIDNDHVFDALMCVCAGLDFLAGRVQDPPDDFDIKGEGWIWIRPPELDTPER